MTYKVTQKAIKSQCQVSQILKFFFIFKKKKFFFFLYPALVPHAGPNLPRPVLLQYSPKGSIIINIQLGDRVPLTCTIIGLHFRFQNFFFFQKFFWTPNKSPRSSRAKVGAMSLFLGDTKDYLSNPPPGPSGLQKRQINLKKFF